MTKQILENGEKEWQNERNDRVKSVLYVFPTTNFTKILVNFSVWIIINNIVIIRIQAMIPYRLKNPILCVLALCRM